MKEKLVEDKESAFISKEIATIYRDVPLNVKLEDIKFKGIDFVSLNKIYEELEFRSLLKKQPKVKKNKNSNLPDINLKSLILSLDIFYHLYYLFYYLLFE